MAYTKEQARQEWERFLRAETAAATAAEEADRKQYEAAKQAATDKADADAAAKTAAVDTAYHAARIQQLADDYRLREQIANRGLTRSGTAAAAHAAATAVGDAARQTANRRRQEALTAVGRALVTATEQAEDTYRRRVEDTRRKLSEKLEQKRLVLLRSTKEGEA